MARVDERTLDNNSLGILTLAIAGNDIGPDIGHLAGKLERRRFRERYYGITGPRWPVIQV
jgi:hypothetical protein